MDTHILAIGGGGCYGPQGGPSKILRYFLDLTGKRFPKVCIIPTATGDSDQTVNEYVRGFNRLAAHPNYLSLYHIPTRDLEDFIMDFDAVYVSGGNTKNLLALWREWGLDEVLTDAWKAGIVMGGASAGGICWFEEGSTDSWPNEYNPLKALGILPGSFCPHFSDENKRRASYLQMVEEGQLSDGYGVSDRAALHYVNGELTHAVAEMEEAFVKRVTRDQSGKISEEPVDLRQL
ncbi:Type 1 glutamine amidotransferase-like domain-containing protein [Planctomycetota bacterium]